MNKTKPVLSRLFDIAAQGRGKLISSCTLMSLGTLSGMVPYLSVYHIARLLLVSEIGNSRSGILLWSIIAVVSIVLNMILSFFGSFGAHKVAFRVLYGIRIRVMEHMGRLPMGFFTEHSTGSVQKTMDDSIEKNRDFYCTSAARSYWIGLCCCSPSAGDWKFESLACADGGGCGYRGVRPAAFGMGRRQRSGNPYGGGKRIRADDRRVFRIRQRNCRSEAFWTDGDDYARARRGD